MSIQDDLYMEEPSHMKAMAVRSVMEGVNFIMHRLDEPLCESDRGDLELAHKILGRILLTLANQRTEHADAA